MALEGWPGEALFIKIWDTLFDKGVAGLLRPKQILREEAARTEARRQNMLVIEQTYRDIESVRAGTMAYEEGKLVPLPRPAEPLQIEKASATEPTVQETPGFDAEYFLKLSQREAAVQQIEKLANLHKIALFAEEEAEGTPNEAVSDEKIDTDWFTRWRDYAQKVSNEELQRLWARILNGELKEPGRFSIHTMDILSRLSTSDAELISIAARHRIVKHIVRNAKTSLENAGLSYEVLLRLEALGVAQAVEAIGGAQTKLENLSRDAFQTSIVCNNRALLVEHEDPDKTVTLPVYAITMAGVEIMSLGSFEANEEYMREIGESLKGQGLAVQIGDWHPLDNSRGVILNKADI